MKINVTRPFGESPYVPYPPATQEDLNCIESDDRLVSLQKAAETSVSRRSFLRLAGRAAVGAGLVATSLTEAVKIDTFLGDMLTPVLDMKLEHVSPPKNELMGDRATLFIPGFNVQSALPAAQALAQEAAHHGHVVAFTHATNRFSIDNLEAHIRQYIQTNDIRHLSAFGSSMGGLIAVELAARIPELQTIIVDSAPADPSDARQLPQGFMKQVTEGVSWLLDKIDITGGPATRVSVEFVKRLHDGDKSALACLKEALSQDYASSCSNALALDLYLFLLTHNIHAKGAELEGKELAYVGAADPLRDAVVDQGSSVAKYAAMASLQNIAFSHATSDATGHADVATQPQAYTGMYRAALSSLSSQRQAALLGNRGKMFLNPHSRR